MSDTGTGGTFGSTGFDVADFYSNLGGGHSGDFALSGSEFTFTVVPEPAAAWLGAIGSFLLRRRR